MDKKDSIKQLELFPGAVERHEASTKRSRFFDNCFVLNTEHIIVLLVVLLMVGVFSFSLGVEKGKRISVVSEVKESPALEERIEEAEVIAEPTPTSVSTPTANVPTQVPDIKKEIDLYTIQVASLKNRDSADQEAKKLENKGYETVILKKGNWLVLCVGKFSNKAEAETFRKELKKKYRDCLIRSL